MPNKRKQVALVRIVLPDERVLCNCRVGNDPTHKKRGYKSSDGVCRETARVVVESVDGFAIYSCSYCYDLAEIPLPSRQAIGLAPGGRIEVQDVEVECDVLEIARRQSGAALSENEEDLSDDDNNNEEG